jgi:hypothetical protein
MPDTRKRPEHDSPESLRLVDAQGYIHYPHIEEPMRSRIERIVNEKPQPRSNYKPTPTEELRNRTQQTFFGYGLRKHSEAATSDVSGKEISAYTASGTASVNGRHDTPYTTTTQAQALQERPTQSIESQPQSADEESIADMLGLEGFVMTEDGVLIRAESLKKKD